jgi:hypothetical protein
MFKNKKNKLLMKKLQYENKRLQDLIDLYKYDISASYDLCRMTDMLLSETIKEENGEKSSTSKFNDVKSLAKYIKEINAFNMGFLYGALQKNNNIRSDK